MLFFDLEKVIYFRFFYLIKGFIVSNEKVKNKQPKF